MKKIIGKAAFVLLLFFIAGTLPVLAQDYGFVFFGTGNSNSSQEEPEPEKEAPRPQIVGYEVTVRGPLFRNNGPNTTQYGPETYEIYTPNESAAKSEAIGKFRSQHRPKPDASVTVISTKPIYR